MQRDSMVFYRSYYEAGRFLDDKERLDYYDRILNYGIEWVEKKKTDKVEMLFWLVKPNIDSSQKRYDISSKQWHHWKKGKAYGKLGWRPRTKQPTNPLKGGLDTTPENNPLNVDVDKDIDDNIDIDNKDTTIVVATPESFWNSDINEILEKIKMYNNNIVDWTQKEQRQYWKMLFDKLKQIDSVKNNNYSAAWLLEIILQIISKNEYHSHKIVWPKKIYYELAGLMQICKQESVKNTPKKAKTF